MKTNRNAVFARGVDKMILNPPPITIVVCLATLIVSAAASAQTMNGSLRRQAVEPARQQPDLKIDWRSLSKNSRSNPRSSSTARILMDETSDVVDLRNSPNQTIGRPGQPVSRPQHREAPPVRYVNFEADVLPKVGTITTNRILEQPPSQSFEPENSPAAPTMSPQTGNMAAIGHAFNSIRSEGVLPQHQLARANSQTDYDNQRFETERRPPASEFAPDDSERSNSSATGSNSFSSSNDSGNRQMIEKIAYNTLFVLAFGVGFVLIARVWVKPNKGGNTESNDAIEVISSLKLPGKSNLMLVKVGGEKMMVALDASGVKSVVHLTESFANKLAAYSDSPEEAFVTARSPEAEPRIAAPAPTPSPTKTKKLKPKSPVYSLDSVLGEHVKKQTLKQDNAEKNTEAIREQMEAALLKFGLKGLV